MFYQNNQRMVVSIILPTLNEEEGLKKTLYSIPRAELMESGYEVDVLVVDGDSTDNTRQIGQQLGARVIRENRKGYGRAYKTGFQEAAGDIIVTMDADDTYPAELIGKYIEELVETDCDFITIDRFARMEKGSMSLVHKLGNKILSQTMNLIFSTVVNDSQSGMWIMKKAFADQINLMSDDMCMSEEIKIIAFKYFRAKELPGRYSERTGPAKLATLRHGWVNFRYLFSYRKLIGHAIKSRKLVPSSSDLRR